MHVSKHFLLGAATAGHQVEGSNTHSNWWHEEQLGRMPQSGAAADHFRLFDSDFAMAQQLGLNAMRISIEWSRIEPEEGEWDQAAIAHYHKVFSSLHKRGLTPMVTLFHWTMPQWLAEKGGFETAFGVKMFRGFVQKIAREFGAECQLWTTVNEPEVYAFSSYYNGTHPPFEKNLRKSLIVYRNLMKAHDVGYDALHKYARFAKVGVAKNVSYAEPLRAGNVLDKFVVKIGQKFGNEFFIDRIKNKLDFVGLNYYFTHRLRFSFQSGFKMLNDEYPYSEMGNRTYPDGLFYLLKRFAKYGKPLYVTENGIANCTDPMRADFITQHLNATIRAKNSGVPVKGYFYWSLLDTYEWQSGYDLKFGLAEVNFETQKRKLRVGSQLFGAFKKK